MRRVWGALGSCPPGRADDLVGRVRGHGNQQNSVDTDARASCIPAVWGRSAGAHGGGRALEPPAWLRPQSGPRLSVLSHVIPARPPSALPAPLRTVVWTARERLGGQPTLRTVPRLYCVGGIASLAFCQRREMATYCEFRTLCLLASEGVCAGGCLSCPTSSRGLPAHRVFPWLSSRRHSPIE